MNAPRIPIYLSGSSQEWSRIVRWAPILEQTGRLTIVSDWHRKDPASWTGKDHTRTRDEQASIALEELDQVRSCSVFWMFWPKATSHGAYVELGAALERKAITGRPHVVVTGWRAESSIFTGPADFRDVTDALGFHEVTRFANQLAKGMGNV